jgi:hypothetical protein
LKLYPDWAGFAFLSVIPGGNLLVALAFLSVTLDLLFAPDGCPYL